MATVALICASLPGWVPAPVHAATDTTDSTNTTVKGRPLVQYPPRRPLPVRAEADYALRAAPIDVAARGEIGLERRGAATAPTDAPTPPRETRPAQTSPPSPRPVSPATEVHTIALLLPMTGPLASAAHAVRDGFMAALFRAPSPRPKLVFIDSSAQGIDTAYRDALAAGAQFIVGPLDRSELTKLNMAGNLAVPTLALNYLPAGSAVTANLYQFGLAPEDEAREVAERAFADGHQAVLIVTMHADWAQRASGAFAERWSQLGGQVLDRVVVVAQGEIEKQVKAALLIPEGQARWAAVAQALAFNPQFRERYRRDIDAIVLFARPGFAGTVNATLKYHFAEQLPVYATSHVYGAGDGSDNDLNGIRFCDTPWHLQGDPLRTQLRAAFPKASGDQANLYALGVDAFNLQSQLKTLLAARTARVNGATGILSIGGSARIARELSWATFVNGAARTIANESR